MRKLILTLILLLAFLLRTINLAQIPPGLNHDEASIGLDAYSLLKTGQDEYGKSFPIAFTAGEARPPLYVYLTIPFIALFDLSVFSIRLLSTLAGTLTVLVTYFLAKKIFNQKIAFLSAFFLALSPWHLRFSRMAMEATLALFFFSLAVLFFLYSQKELKFFILSSWLLVFSFFSYYNYQLLAPLFFILFLFLQRKKIFTNKKVFFLTLLPWVVGGTLFLWAVHYQNALFRFSQINLAATKPTALVLVDFVKNYFQVFSPKFLLIAKTLPFSENLRHKAPIFLIDYLLFLLGIIIFLKNFKIKKKPGLSLIILWLLVAPIPSSLVGRPESQRNLILAPVFFIIAALGLISLLDSFFKKSKIFAKIFFITLVARRIPRRSTAGMSRRSDECRSSTTTYEETASALRCGVFILFFSFYVFSSLSFLRYYFVQYSTDYAHFWASSWQKGFEYAQKNQKQVQKVFFVDLFDHELRRYAVDQQINPQKIQKIIDHPTQIGELPVKFLNGYYFIQSESAQKENLKKEAFKNSLIVDFTGLFSPQDFPQAKFKDFFLPNNVWIYQSIKIL